MHHIHRHPIIGALAAATLAIATTATADDDPLTGIWHGTWPSRASAELTVVDVADGQALGTYCRRWSDGVGRDFVDLNPDTVPAPINDEGAIEFRIGKIRYAFRPDPQNGDVVEFIFRRSATKKYTLDLQKVDDQPCAERYVALTPPTDTEPPQTIADTLPAEPEHWLIGAWTGATNTGLPIELTVTHVDGRGFARGIYCNHRNYDPGPLMSMSDLHPATGRRARVASNAMKFASGNITFGFTRTDDPDVLTVTREQGGKSNSYPISRTDEPACASRITPLVL